MVPIQEYMFSQKCFKLIDTFALSVFTEPAAGTTTSSPDPGPTKLVTEEGHGSHAQDFSIVNSNLGGMGDRPKRGWDFEYIFPIELIAQYQLPEHTLLIYCYLVQRLSELNKQTFKVIPLKLFYYQTFFETWRNEHS